MTNTTSIKHNYLEETKMLNYSASKIQQLVQDRKWNFLDDYSKIRSIYNYVRDEINFGYNTGDEITALQVLKDGYGQCNTKATLLMALLRCVNIPCRIHGFTVSNKVQLGATSGFLSRKIPSEVLHTWVEVLFEDTLYHLEGVIIDHAYLKGLQIKFNKPAGAFCGYGVCIDDIENPPIDWNRNHTYIQKDAIRQDYGLYDSPDALTMEHKQPLSPSLNLFYKHFGRHIMNRNVSRIRKLYKDK